MADEFKALNNMAKSIEANVGRSIETKLFGRPLTDDERRYNDKITALYKKGKIGKAEAKQKILNYINNSTSRRCRAARPVPPGEQEEV